jgi:acyl-CoA synthetase (AMP-forming)/AMP-acid ligase II
MTALLLDRVLEHAATRPDDEAVVHWTCSGDPVRLTWAELVASARAHARNLREQNVRPGDVCAVILRPQPELYGVWLGVQAAGAIPAVLPFPNPRTHPDKLRHGLEGMASSSGLDFILTDASLEASLRPLVTGAKSTVRAVLLPRRAAADVRGDDLCLDGVRPDAPALLQHSSGTTGLQKAVMLSHEEILRHAAHYAAAIRLSPSDRVVSWLPLYHDMGLIAAFLVPLLNGVTSVQMDPFEWVAAPITFMQAVSRERGTLAWLPNFAYGFMAERLRPEDMEGLRLDSVRLLVNCSEPIRAESHDRFRAAFEPFGLRPGALAGCYAMAETTFAVTQTRPSADARRLDVDRDRLAAGFVEPAREAGAARTCASSGAPIEGCRLDVRGDDGAALPAGRVGEIWVRSESMFSGYRNRPELTAEVLQGGWYRTGDYGFVDGGECFVVGRKKDIIIVAGKNIYPEDVEDAVNEVPGVLKGRVVAVGLPDERLGTERVAVIAESELTAPAEVRRLELDIKRTGIEIDVSIAEVFVVPPRWLVKSSSGKPSRKENKARIQEGRSRGDRA